MMPPAASLFVSFPTLLRANGFAVAPDQTMGFIEAVGLILRIISQTDIMTFFHLSFCSGDRLH